MKHFHARLPFHLRHFFTRRLHSPPRHTLRHHFGNCRLYMLLISNCRKVKHSGIGTLTGTIFIGKKIIYNSRSGTVNSALFICSFKAPNPCSLYNKKFISHCNTFQFMQFSFFGKSVQHNSTVLNECSNNES